MYFKQKGRLETRAESVDLRHWKTQTEQKGKGWAMYGFVEEGDHVTLVNFIFAKERNDKGNGVVELVVFCNDPASTFGAYPEMHFEIVDDKLVPQKREMFALRPSLQLYDQFEKKMRDAKVNTIILDAIPNSERFWWKQGYRHYPKKEFPPVEKLQGVPASFEAACRTTGKKKAKGKYVRYIDKEYNIPMYKKL